MKINMPVTDKEILFDDTQFMLTKTDLKGVITYANHDFIKISGFSEEELVGHSHNVVRHPDMPVEAFADMWAQLKAGRPWTGLVKNRTKTGDYYWVEANATPVVENGVVAGYLSVRRKPSRQQVDDASKAYQLFKNGQAKGLSIVDGKVVKQSKWLALLHKWQDVNVAKRLMAIVGIGLSVVLVQAAIGLYELNASNNSVNDVYVNRMIPVEDLSTIQRLMLENRTYLRIALSEVSIRNEAKKNSAGTGSGHCSTVRASH